MFRLARASLANRLLVALVTLLIAGFGVYSMAQLKQELIPSIELPQTTVVTVSPGASPEIVDEQISQPLSKAIGNLDRVEQVITSSSSGVSMVSIGYEFGTDAEEFRTGIQAAIDSLADSLPTGAEPQVSLASTSDLPIVFLTASSDDASASMLTETLTNVVVPRLEGVPGVRDVSISGGQTERVVITPDQAALAAQGLSTQAIGGALEANGMTLPLGTLSDDGTVVPVQGGTPIDSLDAVRDLPLANPTRPGAVVALGEVASVERVPVEPSSITRMNGDEAISLSVTAVQDGDVVAISHGVADALDELRAENEDLHLTIVFDQAPFIEESIEHLAVEGLLGLLFAVVVILLFLFSLSSTLVTAISIPLSVLVTFIGLNLGGHSLNMLTLGALTIAIGRVVDDSIVVIENIKRHLSYGEDKVHAILTAVREVAGAITSSTLTTVAVFLPIALVGGMVGELFAPFALTVTIAMLSSLLVALTIVPTLSYWFLPRPKDTVSPEAVREAAEAKERRSLLQRSYLPILRATQRHPVVTLGAAALILVGTGALVPVLKVDFLGNTGQNMVMVTQQFPSGSTLETVSDGATKVEDALDAVDGVDAVMLMAGSGGDFSALLGGAGGTATFVVNTDADADQVTLQEDIRARLADVTDAGDIALADQASMGGFGGSVDVVVNAQDEDQLTEAAEAVIAALQDTENAADITSDLAPAQPVARLEVDRTAALSHGLTEMQVLGAVAGQLSPQSIGSVRLDGEEFSIYLDAAPVPGTPAELRAITLPTTTGLIALSEVARLEQLTVPTSIARQDGELVATVSVTPEAGELGAVTTAVQTRVDALGLPAGVTATIGGLAEQQAESFGQLGIAMLIAIAIVFVLLVATFRSLLQPLILLVSIPFAATGAILLLLATGKPLGISALIGMLMLIGIVVTNAIVLIDLVNQYRQQGQTVQQAVMNGARQRLRPILMTALATIFALLPMAFGVTGSSGFISQDLAIVVIGGLISSTLLTLVLVPVLYRLLENRRELRRVHKAGANHGAHPQAVDDAARDTETDAVTA